MRFRIVALASSAALVTVGIATGAVATARAAPTLHGTVGPGFTISLKNGQGGKVPTLKRGKYIVIVSDKSNIHNFTLKGPGVANKSITGTSFVGMKTATLSLKKGIYRFYCTVHPEITG